MRDSKRINETLEKLRVLWELNPDLRLMQLITLAAANGSGDPFFWEEDKWNELIQDKILESLSLKK